MIRDNSWRRLCVLLVAVLALSAVSAGAQQGRRPALKGSVLFSQNCASCHGSDGRGGERAPNIATAQEVASMSDSRLRAIVSDGIPSAGMPAFSVLGEKQVDAIVAYLRNLQGMTSTAQAALPGDPHAGEALFFAPGSCARCHSVNGRGGFMADDLSSYARGRSAASIQSSIANPPDTSGDRNHLVTLETADGASFAGLIRSQDNFTVVLQSEDGAYHSITRDRIRKLSVSEHSWMPRDYANTLTQTQLSNLVSYLLKNAVTAHAPRIISPDEDPR
ncbi:MAG: c-type cytochrome [Acidobacteriaceae bacterium]